MSTTAGMVEVEEYKERLSWGWAIVFAIFGVGVLTALSLIIASLPESERSIIALGLGTAAIFFAIVGWLEQERSTPTAWGLIAAGVSLGAAVLDGANNEAGCAEWVIGAVGAALVEVLVWLFSFAA